MHAGTKRRILRDLHRCAFCWNNLRPIHQQTCVVKLIGDLRQGRNAVPSPSTGIRDKSRRHQQLMRTNRNQMRGLRVGARNFASGESWVCSEALELGMRHARCRPREGGMTRGEFASRQRPPREKCSVEQAGNRLLGRGASDRLADQRRDRQRPDIGGLAHRLGRLDRVGNHQFLEIR